MKRLLLAFAALVLMNPIAAQAADPQGASAFVDNVAKQVLAVLNTSDSRDAKQQKLETMFMSSVDIQFVAKYVLGQNWRAATPAQQQAYVTAYGPFLVHNYAVRLSKYSGQSYKLKNAREDNGTYVVTMDISDPQGQDVLIDYRLETVGDSYKLVDIMAEGVSLLATQRSEFNSIVQSKGLDYLIAQLSAKKASQ